MCQTVDRGGFSLTWRGLGSTTRFPTQRLSRSKIISRGGSSVPAETSPTEIGDCDSDGIPDLMVKFDRASVYQMLSPGFIQLTVTGSLTTGLSLEGTELVRVIDKGKGPRG